MSIHRRAAKRDANEPAIVSALEALGCVVWRVSGKGLPDLVVFYRRRAGTHMDTTRHTFVADVKGPKDGPAHAQVETWTALTNLGFSVFILRTPEDAQKMLNNALRPWEPTAKQWAKAGHQLDDIARKLGVTPRKGDAATTGGMTVPRNGRDAKKACGCLRSLGRCQHSGNYVPPRSTPMDAAKEAAATFAPPPFQHHSRCTYEGGGLCSCPAGWKG